MPKYVYENSDGSGDQLVLEVPGYVDPPKYFNLHDKFDPGMFITFDLDGEME